MELEFLLAYPLVSQPESLNQLSPKNLISPFLCLHFFCFCNSFLCLHFLQFLFGVSPFFFLVNQPISYTSLIIQFILYHIHRYKCRNALFLHCDTIQDICGFHRTFTVCNDDKLCVLCQLGQIFANRLTFESSSAASISSSRQNGDGFKLWIAKSKEIAVKLFSPPESSDHILQFLSWRLCDDLDSCSEQIFLINKLKVSLTTTEQLLKILSRTSHGSP